MEEAVVLKSNQITQTHKNEHEPYEYYKQEITSRSTFPQCYAAFYDLPPRKSSYPFHYHEKTTELFYIIAGRGLLRLRTREILVEAGDVIVFPPGISGSHKLTNVSDTETLRYLDVDTLSNADVVHYPDSNKIGIIRGGGAASLFYKNGIQTDYYDGE